MKRPLILVAGVVLATVSSAQKSTNAPRLAKVPAHTAPPASGYTYTTPTILSQDGTNLVVDVGGEQSWDGLNDASNTVLSIPIPAGSNMTGIGWDVNLATVGASWLNEAVFYFDGADQDLSGLFLTPGFMDSTPGVEHYSNPVIDLTDNGIPDIPIQGDGTLYIQLFESFDDVANGVDANWNAPSELTIVYAGAAPVPTVGQWGLIGLGVVLLGGVVVMSLRRGATRPAIART